MGWEEGAERERRCITGYEIKYSMSALFWSPPPSSTLMVPHREREWGEGRWADEVQIRRKDSINFTVLVLRVLY